MVIGSAPAAARNCRGDDVAEQVDTPRQRRPATLAGDLRYRAAEIEVDVVGQIFLEDHPHRRADDRGIDAVELEAARPLVRREPDQPKRLGMALDERARRDHLADEQPGTVGPAQPTKGGVRYAGHRRQHDRYRSDHPLRQSERCGHRVAVADAGRRVNNQRAGRQGRTRPGRGRRGPGPWCRGPGPSRRGRRGCRNRR